MNRQNDEKTASNPRERMTMKSSGNGAPDTQSRIEQEVEATLRRFEAEAPPKAGPDFYFAVKRKIRQQEPAPRAPERLGFGRRVLVPAFFALMVVLNIVAAVLVFSSQKTELQAKEQGFSALAQEYALGRIDYAGYSK